ncbi:DUF2231 domain-containing protein [Sphingomicrobium marinum]|uniref:DUF2231 domain-containing protein n=1 Tax=Sphingomicrobium marinum TaxID=1227950 RepID=UPI0022405773|nr:DUF2231 domain-containing protein [Sphingomicrobium marinum]
MGRYLGWWLLLVYLLGAPALAHPDKPHGGNEAPTEMVMNAAAPEVVAAPSPSVEPLGPLARTGRWMGRLHPAIVHFPLALAPLALLALWLARRRKSFEQTASFMIIAAGITGPVAAAVGWLAAVPAWWDSDPIVAWHRWVGTLLGAALGIFGWVVWKRPATLTKRWLWQSYLVLVILLIIQGWLGGAMIHGLNHLNW